MSFYRTNEKGELIRNRVAIDFSDEKILTEQSHKAEVNINNIVKRHGADLIARTAQMSQGTFVMDADPTNDFQEAMLIVTRAQENFSKLPSELRKKFNNNPAEFLDFVQNPDNQTQLVEMGLANPPPKPSAPIEVRVTNPETPPATPAEAG